MRTRNSGTGQTEGSGRSFDSVRGNVPASFAIFVLTMVAAVGCYILYMDTFALPPQPSFSPPFDGYSTAPMQRAIGPDEVGRQQERILDLGSRFPGHPGFYATEDYLKKSFEDAGLEFSNRRYQSLRHVPATGSFTWSSRGALGMESSLMTSPYSLFFPIISSHL